MLIKHDGIEFDIKIITPNRPAPACSNPDSPLFSDPGDSCEFEILTAYNIEDKRYLSELEIDYFYNDDSLYNIISIKSEEDDVPEWEPYNE